ncbi:MAG: 50S ribosomal protein L24 [Candidatus Aminicenantes bacterium]
MNVQKPTMKTKLKKDDPVIVVRGNRKDKGKVGKILRIIPDKQRLVVEKVRVIKEYVRANPQKNIQGGIVDREGSIPLSSVLYYCKECEQGVRIGYRIIEAGESEGKETKSSKGKKSTTLGKPFKQRICKKCGVVLD